VALVLLLFNLRAGSSLHSIDNLTHCFGCCAATLGLQTDEKLQSERSIMDPDGDDYDDGEEERVTATSYGALDTTAVSDECWLIRIPPTLSQLFEQCPEGTELGELVFTKGGTTATGATVKPSLTVHVSETLAEEHLHDKKKTAAAASATASTSAIPLNYSLEAMTKKIPVMHPFVRNPNNGSCTLLGTVSRTANLQVQQDQQYRALLKDRLVASNVNSNRYVKPVEAAESIITKRQQSSVPTSAAATASSSQGKKGFGNAVFQFGQRKLEAASHQSTSSMLGGGSDSSQPLQKRARQFAPDQPVRSVLFALFGQQSHWTIKDLKAAASAGGYTIDKKREQEMREILRNEIGEYHRSGDQKTKWELRQEFQQQQQQQQQYEPDRSAQT